MARTAHEARRDGDAKIRTANSHYARANRAEEMGAVALAADLRNDAAALTAAAKVDYRDARAIDKLERAYAARQAEGCDSNAHHYEVAAARATLDGFDAMARHLRAMKRECRHNARLWRARATRQHPCAATA